MTAKGWDACVQVLRHQPPHLRLQDLSIYFSRNPSAAPEQDMALMRNVLPVLLDRKLFPTLTRLFIERGRPEHTAWLLGLLGKSNVRTPTLYALGGNQDTFSQLGAVLASGRLRHLDLHDGWLRDTVLAVAPHVAQSHGLERFLVSMWVGNYAEIFTYLEPFIAAMTRGAGPRNLKHLSVGISLGPELLLPTEASPWQLLLIPSLAAFRALGDGECWLTPDYLLVLEQCLRARQYYGYPPLKSFDMAVECIDDPSRFVEEAEKACSIVSGLSPSTTIFKD